VWNKEPYRVSRYRLCVAPNSAEKIIAGIKCDTAPVPRSWRRQWFYMGMNVQGGIKAVVSIRVPKTVLRVKGTGQWAWLG